MHRCAWWDKTRSSFEKSAVSSLTDTNSTSVKGLQMETAASSWGCRHSLEPPAQRVWVDSRLQAALPNCATVWPKPLKSINVKIQPCKKPYSNIACMLCSHTLSLSGVSHASYQQCVIKWTGRFKTQGMDTVRDHQFTGGQLHNFPSLLVQFTTI